MNQGRKNTQKAYFQFLLHVIIQTESNWEILAIFPILVVEDAINSTVLNHPGYTVFEAGKGLEDLELMDIQHIDLVVLNVKITKKINECYLSNSIDLRFTITDYSPVMSSHIKRSEML